MSLPASTPSPEPQHSWPSQTGKGSRQLRELGGLAAWSVTSAKPGNGVELLRDGSTETYWQSDGIQPHLVNIQFNKRVAVQEIHLYLDYKSDESYTPSRLSVRAGSAYHDLKDICIVELREPSGWIKVPLSGASLSMPNADQPMQAFFYQVAVLTNHQNGRDTHIRQILLFGPSVQTGNSNTEGCMDTLESSMFATIR